MEIPGPITPYQPNALNTPQPPAAPAGDPGGATTRPSADPENAPLLDAFRQFVGETFYGQMLKQMRATVGKSEYFDGGRAEAVFTGQLDQHLSQSLAKSSSSSLADPMFDLFMLGRPN